MRLPRHLPDAALEHLPAVEWVQSSAIPDRVYVLGPDGEPNSPVLGRPLSPRFSKWTNTLRLDDLHWPSRRGSANADRRGRFLEKH